MWSLNCRSTLERYVLELFAYLQMIQHAMSFDVFFCVQENLEPLIEYVAESFWDQLVKSERLKSIQAFKLKYHLMSIKSDVPEKASNLFAPCFACMQSQLPTSGSIVVCLCLKVGSSFLPPLCTFPFFLRK